MIKHKKIRGHKRRLKQIEEWRQYHLSVNLEETLRLRERDYTKIRIYPWTGIMIGNSIAPEVKGKTKQAILNGLLDIYDHWKQQLDKTGKPYYLKIWLYEPHFSESQVVCAVGNKLNFYDDAFLEGDDSKLFQTKKYGCASNRLEQFYWQHHIQESHLENNFVGNINEYVSPQDFYETRRWFSQMLKRPHRTTAYDEKTADCFEFYSFKKGYVWIGGKN